MDNEICAQIYSGLSIFPFLIIPFEKGYQMGKKYTDHLHTENS